MTLLLPFSSLASLLCITAYSLCFCLKYLPQPIACFRLWCLPSQSLGLVYITEFLKHFFRGKKKSISHTLLWHWPNEGKLKLCRPFIKAEETSSLKFCFLLNICVWNFTRSAMSLSQFSICLLPDVKQLECSIKVLISKAFINTGTLSTDYGLWASRGARNISCITYIRHDVGLHTVGRWIWGPQGTGNLKGILGNLANISFKYS